VGAIAGAESGQRGGDNNLEAQAAVDQAREEGVMILCCSLIFDDVLVYALVGGWPEQLAILSACAVDSGEAAEDGEAVALRDG